MSPLKNDFKNWRNYVNEDLIIENRYTDAVAYAQNLNKGGKQYKVKDVIDGMSEEQRERIKVGAKRAMEIAREDDPSGDNKYIMWVARFVRKDLMRRLQKYGKQWSTSPVLWDDPEAVKDSIHDPDYVAANLASSIVDVTVGLMPFIQNYHLLKEKNLIKKDIYDYDPQNEVGEFKNDVANGMKEYEGRQEKDKLKQQVKGEADDLLETEDYSVIRPNTEGASCYYGWGTRWCISARESRNYFAQYSGEGKVFYFVMFRHILNSSDYKKMALVYGKEQGYDTDPEQVFDAADNEVADVGLVEGITENLFYKIINQAPMFEKTREKIKNNKDPEARASSYLNVKDVIASMIEEGVDGDAPPEQILSIANYLFPDTYSEEIDLEITPLQERFDELVQETYSDITGNAAYHAEQNPGGPKSEDYEKLYDQYGNLEHISVSYDEYDENSWYWDASASISPTDDNLEDLNLPEDIDMDQFTEVVESVFSNSNMYADEIESDGFDGVSIRFTPDYDENQGIDGFERFLERMSEYDDYLESGGDFWDGLAEALMESGLTAGGLKEFEGLLDEAKFENVEYSIDGKTMKIVLELDPVLARPKGMSGLYFGRLITGLTGYEQDFQGMGTMDHAPGALENIPNEISARTLEKIEKAIEAKYDMLYLQSELPGFNDPEPEDLDALPMIDMKFVAQPGQIKFYGPDGSQVKDFDTVKVDKGGGGMNIEYPYNFVLSLTNQEYWDTFGMEDEETESLIKFIKWIDQTKVKDQIEGILQGALNDVALKLIKLYPPETAPAGDTEEEGEEEQQVAEVFKRWNKFLR